ncbi:substrate-binding domain-containing protein [Syntrophus aciditrophicus]|uniref:ABC-type tungstate transport system, solute-binding protein n=1 Tax=Syntrophus aciditrophicus (strain SB) TaxID=56780 RepID=Q2LPG8_SYNAS|nr:substrate-binding domain-containing protein [Syntrophus aciditrophicus]ABC76044.1 ABC-type tungstate transport system, solute-binding protein [Syntrophus aciditrophicus SB]OPY16460.1 MAG: PBP superfamily domain protein [Syntrophus sp. PtaB.Bin075]
MKRLFLYLLTFLWLGFPGLANAVDGSKFVLLSSTIGPIDAGIVDALENAFEKETDIRVRHVGAGTGAALDIARKGNVDLVMVHAKSLEEKFVQEGFGTQRIPLMYNDFVLVGPAADPAGIKGMKTAAEALGRIAEKGVPFISRGDKSGTHVAEMELWGKAGLKPAGSWYQVYEKGSEGNAPTLKYTNQQGAYTVIDRATYLALKDQISLVILVEGDEAMLNYISLIPVSQKKFKTVNATDTMRFVNWLTDPKKGQLIIRDFGKEKYGAPLFFPNSEAWQKAQKK